MMKTDLTLSCCLCSESYTEDVVLPQGWVARNDFYVEDGFCPKHSVIDEWVSAQCPGCVGGWTDCGLWRDFAYQNRGLTINDLNDIRAGTCPRRVNGTGISDSAGIHMVDLSERATTSSGEELVQAILDYWARYNPGVR